MRHRPTDATLIELSNEVPGGAELADLARLGPEVLRVTDTQWKFMDKLGMLNHGVMTWLASTAIRVERT